MASRKSFEVRSIVYAGVCLALCMVLPLFTGNNPELGKKLSLIHIPVFLCGFISGPVWGCVIGAVAPLMRHLLFGAPANLYEAMRMMAELAVYGLASGLFYRYLPKKPFGIYVSLLSAQFFGRLAWGLMAYFFSLFDKGNAFYVEMVVTSTVSGSLLGIAIQLLLIPPIVYAMQRARFISKY